MQVRARDYHSNWMTAVACLDEDCYLGAENSYNLFTARKNSDSAADDERNRLEVLRSSPTVVMLPVVRECCKRCFCQRSCLVISDWFGSIPALLSTV